MSKILIVGADPHEVQSVVSIIQKDGHEHSVAPDISEGIRLAKNLPFDSLLLVKNDVRGGGAVQFIKKMKEEVILLPVLVFTDQTPHENNISLCSDMERLMPYGESRGFLYTQKFDKTLLKSHQGESTRQKEVLI